MPPYEIPSNKGEKYLVRMIHNVSLVFINLKFTKMNKTQLNSTWVNKETGEEIDYMTYADLEKDQQDSYEAKEESNDFAAPVENQEEDPTAISDGTPAENEANSANEGE